MTNFFDVNAAIQKPNMLASLQQGYAAGTNRRIQRQEEARVNEFRSLENGIVAGDQRAIDRGLALDPQGTLQRQQGADSQLKRMEGALKLVFDADAHSPEAAENAYRLVRPWLNKVSPDGVEPPLTWAEAKPKAEAARARLQSLFPPQGQAGKVVGNALVDPVTGREIYRGPEVPVNAQLVPVPDGKNGQVWMMFDPRARTLSDLPMPNGGPGAASPMPAAGNGFATATDAEGNADPTMAALPESEQIKAAQLATAGRDFHVVGGRVVEGQSAGAGGPAPSPNVGGIGHPAPAPAPRLGYVPPQQKPAPSGWRYGADGETLEPIPGGPADKPADGAVTQLSPAEVEQLGFPPGSVIQRKPDGSLVKVHVPNERDANGGKALPGNVVSQLTKDAENLNILTDLSATFSDDFAGNVVGGGVENLLGRLGGERVGATTEGQSRWWQTYDRYKNVIRNELFGSALTPSEQAAFEAADITPNMDPTIIRDNLANQTAIVKNALDRRAKVWSAQGYNPEAVTAATRVEPRARPAADMSDDELKQALGL